AATEPNADTKTATPRRRRLYAYPLKQILILYDSAVDVAGDEVLDRPVRVVVVVLLRRRLHEVRRGRHDRAGQAAVEADLRGPDRVDDDAGRVWRVPDLELELGAERYVAEGLALKPDVRPLAVVQPRHVVRRSNVDVRLGHLVRHLGGDRLGLRDLLRDQAG